ncbi:hypothetical protein QJS10_CPA10g01093 [Acorus calamus]|uniref:Man1/Src1-like C-terminal domain-containing protein n=1 Tax=Acorus calamus TaxID=4465 RepID=A0AAV9DYP4_ACOCL|nr:hypothetical protein QJS10_CPA10g01093 [Acorus calamus]
MFSNARTKRRAKSTVVTPSPPLPFLGEPSESLYPSREDLWSLLAVVAIAASVIVACNFVIGVLNRKPKPFCDSVGESSNADSLSDFCEPCPKNGVCSDGELECVHGYKKLGRTCVEDGEINQTAKKLSEQIELRLCQSHAQHLCEGTGAIWFQEVDILKELDEQMLMGNSGLTKEIFIYAKQRAMGIIESSLEVQISDGVKLLKCPEQLAVLYRPRLCCIRQWIHRNALIILPLPFLLIILMKLLRKIRRSRYLSTRAEELYEQVCDTLEENAMSSKTTSGERECWVVASQLRDHLLLPKERKDAVLWKKVEELIQEDSRIDQYPKLIKGESKIVFEWQASLSSRTRMKRATRMEKLVNNVFDSHIKQQRKLEDNKFSYAEGS